MLIQSACTFGQHPSFKLVPSQYELEYITLNNKEDVGFLGDAIDDKEGYIWVSGAGGLHVFDGHNLVTYNSQSIKFPYLADSIPVGISSVIKNSRGLLYIIGNGNVFTCFDPQRRSLVNVFRKKMTDDDIMKYSAVSPTDEVFRVDLNYKTTGLSLIKINQLPQGADSITAIYKSNWDPGKPTNYKLAAGNHWIVVGEKIKRISLRGNEIKEFTNSDASVSFFYVYADGETIYFMDNKFKRIYTWNKQHDKIEVFVELPEVIKGKISTFLVKDKQVYLTSNLHLFILDKTNYTIQDLSPGFYELAKKKAPNSFANEVMKTLVTGSGDHYLVTEKDLYRIKKKQPVAEKFRQQVNASGNLSTTLSFRALAEDDSKNVYASYYTGITKKEKGPMSFSAMPAVNDIVSNVKSTYSLNYWKNHLLWNNVAIHLTSGKKYFMGNSFGGHCTQYLKNDSLWLFQWGTDKLHCYDLRNQQLTTYPFEKTFGNNGNIDELNDMTGDATGQNLWVCTKLYGIILLTKTGRLLKQYSPKQLGLAGELSPVNDLYLAGDNLWFGCSDGLGVLNISTDKTIIYKNPLITDNGVLLNRTVFSVLPDSTGNFYLGSSNGLLYFNTTTKQFYNLGNDHPIATIEFNRASVLKGSDGRYYFGTTDGLYSFMPDELEFFKSPDSIRPVKIYGISIFNSREKSYRHLSKNINDLDALVLQPFDTNIEFNLSVPEFNKDVYYSYRIKGQNETWTDYKPENKIFVYGLLPGKFVLEIKASTDLSDENASFYSLPVMMKQVWYKKDWVITLFILTALGLVFVLTRWLYNQKLKRQKDLADLRTKISSDLHDDVGTILSGLAMQSQMLTYSANAEQKESLKEISNMSRDAMEHMRDTVWAMDSRKDKFENLVDRMRAFAEKNLAMKNMTHEFIISDIDTKKFIDPEKRQTIYLIFKEAITNIIKHSDANHAAIHLKEEKNKLSLSINDNGTEKILSKSDGLGLINMKMRAEKIGGTLTTKYDNGFVVELII